MANISLSKPWKSRHLRPTDELTYLSRRALVRKLGIAAAGLLTLPVGCSKSKEGDNPVNTANRERDFTFEGQNQYYPAARNTEYKLDRPISDRFVVTRFNNFYEFNDPQNPNIKEIFRYVEKFDNRDWQLEVDGLVGKAGKFHLGELIQEFGLEERIYRHRCVEAWAMAVPWIGFPLAKLISFLEPDNSATHLRLESFADQNQMQGVAWQTWYPWPYFEALRLEEAMNEVAFIATGLYGEPLPKQNGAPVRLVIPWKYGFKSIKSIVKLTFTNQQPQTFWNSAAPQEYSITANVNPDIPHPRWSQEFETMIDTGERRRTIKYNGYGDYVAHLYR